MEDALRQADESLRRVLELVEQREALVGEARSLEGALSAAEAAVQTARRNWTAEGHQADLYRGLSFDALVLRLRGDLERKRQEEEREVLLALLALRAAEDERDAVRARLEDRRRRAEKLAGLDDLLRERTHRKTALLRHLQAPVVERLDEVTARMARLKRRVRQLEEAEALLAQAVDLAQKVETAGQAGLSLLDAYADGLVGLAVTSEKLQRMDAARKSALHLAEVLREVEARGVDLGTLRGGVGVPASTGTLRAWDQAADVVGGDEVVSFVHYMAQRGVAGDAKRLRPRLQHAREAVRKQVGRHQSELEVAWREHDGLVATAKL